MSLAERAPDGGNHDPRIVTQPGSYDELIGALRDRAAQLKVATATLDEVAGLPAGYVAKVLGPSQVRKLGWLSTWLILPALGLRLALIEDPIQLKAMSAHYGTRRANQARPNHYASPVSMRVVARANRHLSQLACKARWRGTTKAQRSEHARMMARARWLKSVAPHNSARRRCRGKNRVMAPALAQLRD